MYVEFDGNFKKPLDAWKFPTLGNMYIETKY
jgi:hypothetical protein